jgi:hypothetical protein
MSHKTEIVKFEKLSNGQCVAVIRCCGHPDTDHAHTMNFLADKETRAAVLAEVHKFVAAQHEASQNTTSEMVDKIGEQVEHA